MSFPPLPLDIARYIFELAAIDLASDLDTNPRSILRVSREVFRWTQPVFWRKVHLMHLQSCWDKGPDYYQAILRQPSLAPQISEIVCDCGMHHGDLPKIIPSCTNLKRLVTLSCHHEPLGVIPQSLRELACSSSSVPNLLVHPFRNLSRLYVVKEPTDDSWSCICSELHSHNFPLLTHFFIHHDFLDTAPVFCCSRLPSARSQPPLPPFLQVGVLYFATSPTRSVLDQDSLVRQVLVGEFDKRITLAALEWSFETPPWDLPFDQIGAAPKDPTEVLVGQIPDDEELKCVFGCNPTRNAEQLVAPGLRDKDGLEFWERAENHVWLRSRDKITWETNAGSRSGSPEVKRAVKLYTERKEKSGILA